MAETTAGHEREARLELVLAEASRGGRLRAEALVTSEAIRRVDFFLDGELVESDRRFPFCALIQPPSPRRSVLEAVALAADGTELARDRVPLDGEPDTPTTVSVAEVREIEGGGWLEVAAEIRHPETVGVERVDFYRDERYVASVATRPYRTRIPLAEGSFLRAVALTSDGGLAEGVRLLGRTEGGDTLSVGLVELYAMVTTRSGAPVEGLSVESFELLQAGSRRSIERFSEGDAVPLSLGLVLDSSGSMHDDMDRAKRSARNFLESVLDEHDEALLIDFDSRPRMLQTSTGDLDALVGRFDEIRSRGGSAIYDAILFAALQLERAAGRKALVVLTDGRDSGSHIDSTQCAAAARRAGVPIFVLSLGHPLGAPPSHDRIRLRELAESTGGSLHPIHLPADVDAAYRAIEHQLRGQYLLGFSTDRPLSAAELDSLTVSVGDRKLRVRTILGGQVRVGD